MIIVLGILWCSVVYSKQIKLQCDYDSTFTFTDGSEKHTNGNGELKIDDYGGGDVFIFFEKTRDGDDFSISSLRKVNTISVKNDSHGDVWDITKEQTDHTGYYQKVFMKVVVDKKTGSLFANEVMTTKVGVNKRMTTGTCDLL